MALQEVKDFFRRIFSLTYVKSPIIAIGILITAALIFFVFLYIFTRHGQGIEVPNFSGNTQEQAFKLARKKNLRLTILDSVYISTRKPSTIVEQSPAAGTLVKSNRTIFLTINASAPKMVEMPDVVGVTLRQAKSTLELQGFTIEMIQFTPDIGINNVLEQRFKKKKIEPGTQIPKGSSIELLLGRGFANEKTILPRIIGFTLSDARNILIEASLNIGNIIFDNTVKDLRDSLQAKVYSQYPAFTEETPLNFGARVDLWLTVNESRIPRLAEEADPEEKIIYEEPEEDILE
jgi:eukaryotic-like serine/threonine-protein kinase